MLRVNPVAFYRELRRRRMVQVVFIYAAAAGAVISACDWIFPQLPELVAQPERALRWVIIAAVASAPLALIFGWLYDLTVEGVQRTPSFSNLAHDPDTSLHRIDRWVIGGLSAALVGIVAAAVIRIAQLEPLEPPATGGRAPVALDPMALAVLPLIDRSDDGESAELLAFGLHDTLLTLLSRISAVRVLSRTTMEHYHGTSKPLPEIARELGVANVMEGSVQRVGNQVRVTVQLIRAPGDEHVWAEVYDRELTATNLFQIQTEIARAVAAQLAAALSPEEEHRLAIVPTSNTEAYTAYMLGRQKLRDRKVELLAQAVDQFARAIELDPNYASAYSGLADACLLYERYSGGHLIAVCPKDAAGREELARKGLAIDDTVGELWVSLGDALARRSEEVLEGPSRSQRESDELAAAARAAFERGLQLSPSFSQGYLFYANHLRAHGQGLGDAEPDLGVNIALKGLRVDPLSIPLANLLSIFYQNRHEFDEAFRYARRMIEIAPDSPRGHERVADLEGIVNGRMDKMILGDMRAARLDPRQPFLWDNSGLAYLNLGDYDMALRYYEKTASIVGPSGAHARNLDLKRAVVLLHQGHRDTAVALLRKTAADAGQELRENLAGCVLADLNLQEGRGRDALDVVRGLFPECVDGDSIPASCKYSRVKLYLARIFQELGRPEVTEQLEPELLAGLQERMPGFWLPFGIGRVQVLAVLGRREQALTALEQAVDQGWRGWIQPLWPGGWRYEMEFDSLLDTIRGDARFKAAFARIEADMREQLEIVREMERRGEIPARNELPEPQLAY